MKSRQFTFEKALAFKDHGLRIEHGGDLRKGKRKLYRPFTPNKSLHLTLRSTLAKNNSSFLKPRYERKIQKIVYNYADRFHVKIFRYANVGNHLHLLVKASTKRGFQNFLRTMTGLIARLVTGAQKGKAKGKFWDDLVYSKLISWGKHFNNTANYVAKNSLEALGIIPPRQFARGHIRINFQELYDG